MKKLFPLKDPTTDELVIDSSELVNGRTCSRVRSGPLYDVEVGNPQDAY